MTIRRLMLAILLALEGMALAGCAGPDNALAPTHAGPPAASPAASPAGPPNGPSDPTGWGHAYWCGTNPPSGYCIVGEPH